MVAFGLGEVVGSAIIGQIIDKWGSRAAALANVCIIISMTGVTLSFLLVNSFNWLAFAMTLLWGIQDSTVNTHCFEMLGFEFDNNVEPFSVFNLWQALGVFIFSFIETLLETREHYIVFISVIGVLGVLSCGTTYYFDFKASEALVSRNHLTKVISF